MSTSYGTTSALPGYTPSALVPSYSPEPADDERLIERAPQSKSRPSTGYYIHKSGRDTVLLTDQDEHADLPTYGRHGYINGYVCIEDRDLVSKVVLTVKGKVQVTISGGDSVSKQTVLAQEHILWSSQNSGSSTCPSNVPFLTVLPASFEHGDATYQLPPSYRATFTASGGLDVQMVYTLSIVVTRTRKFNFLSARDTTSVPFRYAPRTRPSRPIQSLISGFLTDVKVMPEEWRQTHAPPVTPRPKSTLLPVHLHLFIPAAEVFALDDTIPFHVQLTGPAASLRALRPDPTSGRGLQVSLVRQLLAGSSANARFTIARSTLVPVPPGISAHEWDEDASLDWTGELRCGPDTQIGSFDAGLLKVQDCIVVDIFPPAGPNSEFPPIRHSHPIRIVTDSWPDT
ncbi:hypothetical protein DFH09DRAFT_1194305 [Mycena vulgaris]|nr:hypothetical protein DFH09DRAFT_1194305 [Mycena vulgaris]